MHHIILGGVPNSHDPLQCVPYLKYVGKSTKFDALPIQTAQQALDYRLVFHLALKADEVHGALGNSQG